MFRYLKFPPSADSPLSKVKLMLETDRALFFGDNLDILSVKRLSLWFLLLTSAGACTSQTVVNQPQLGVTPALTVERFLQAVNARDLETMSRLFGTDDGPIGDMGSRADVELRMDLIAEILHHDNYVIVSERRVPETESPTQRIGVDILILIPGGTTMVRDVGFTVVLESPGRWLVNVIELTKITEAPPGERRK